MVLLERCKAMNHPWPTACRLPQQGDTISDQITHPAGARRGFCHYRIEPPIREFRVLSGISILIFPARFSISIHSLATFRLAGKGDRRVFRKYRTRQDVLWASGYLRDPPSLPFLGHTRDLQTGAALLPPQKGKGKTRSSSENPSGESCPRYDCIVRDGSSYCCPIQPHRSPH
jgi:hypothetical protein